MSVRVVTYYHRHPSEEDVSTVFERAANFDVSERETLRILDASGEPVAVFARDRWESAERLPDPEPAVNAASSAAVDVEVEGDGKFVSVSFTGSDTGEVAALVREVVRRDYGGDVKQFMRAGR